MMLSPMVIGTPTCEAFSVATAADLRGENLFLGVQNLGGGEFLEKCWWDIFKRQQTGFKLSGFKKALLQNPREMIRGRIFSEMIRIQARKSELQAESRSYGPKVRDTAGQTPRIRTESPREGPRMGFRCFYRNPPLKPS